MPQLAIFALDYLKVTRLLVLHNIAVANCLLVRPQLNAFLYFLVLVERYLVVFSSDLFHQILVSSINRILTHVIQVLLLYFLLVK